MKKNKNNLNFLLIIIIGLSVLFFSLKDNFADTVKLITNINLVWLFIAALLVLGYYLLTTIVLYDFVREFKKEYRFIDAYNLTLKTQFVNGITPFSSGGHPFQIFMFKKEGIPLTKGANIAIQNFIVYQIALVLLGLIAVIYNNINPMFIEAGLMKQLVFFGFILNLTVTILLFVLSFTKKINKFIILNFIKILSKFKIIKNYKETMDNFEHYISNFHDGASHLFKNKTRFLRGIFLNFMALVSIYLVPLAVLFGLGIFSISSYVVVVTSAYVMLIGSFIPVPGSSGGIEFAFASFYGTFIAGASLSALLLIWRFLTYYLGMILGALVFIFEEKK